MKSNRGYKRELLILPFDHRSSFAKKLFGFGEQLSPAQTEEVASYKMVIFEGFERALSEGLPKEKMGILVDEQFGSKVIQRAKAQGITLCVAAEKSGQDEFDFEYGSDFGKHIEKVDPDFVKVLVRYNPEDDETLNQRQAKRLAELSKYLDKVDRKYIFELLVPANEAQLDQCSGDKKVYDVEMRPKLMVTAIGELLKAGVEPDVWKLEGLDREADYKSVCEATRQGNRNDVGVIVLGRGENDEKVKHWLKTGANVPGVIGFAVGRTVFWEPLKRLKEGTWEREKAISAIASNYRAFVQLWLDCRR